MKIGFFQRFLRKKQRRGPVCDWCNEVIGREVRGLEHFNGFCSPEHGGLAYFSRFKMMHEIDPISLYFSTHEGPDDDIELAPAGVSG